MLKKWLAVFMAVVLLIGLAVVGGCGGKQESQDKKAEGKINFPTKPIELTILFGPGSAADLINRKAAELASKELGQPIAPVNRTGAGGAVGYTHVKNQPPDGYNLVSISNGVSTAYYLGNMDFNYTAFSGVAQITTEPVTLAVKADAPWKNINEFVEYAKKNPGQVRIGNSGLGTFTHLTAVALENKTGAKFNHVPFGQGLAVTSLLGGKIEASVQLAAEIMPQVEAGQVRILAVTGEKRLASLLEVPTFKEQGIDLTLTLWRGIAVPKGTPEPVIKILEEAFKKAVQSEEFKEFTKKMGANAEFRPAKEFNEFIAKDDKEIGDLMEQIGMRKQKK
jgi:tripartite-type tricarboxylate transporter receptor subunit TctC